MSVSNSSVGRTLVFTSACCFQTHRSEAILCLVKGWPRIYEFSFSSPENIKALRARLSEIDEDFEAFEVEEFVLYRKVQERLMKAGLVYDTAHEPTCIPPEQV